MILQTLKNLILAKDKYVSILGMGLMKSEARLMFYYGGLETGLFRLLRRSSTHSEISKELKIRNGVLLESLLSLGRSLGDLSLKNGRYSLKGGVSRALAAEEPIADLVREIIIYHTEVARNLKTHMKKGSRGKYLENLGGVIAGSSRISEFLIKSYIDREIKSSETRRILEIGCGSGEYLKYYCAINPGNSGIAVERDRSASVIAARSLSKNGIADRFRVLNQDFLKTNSLEKESFDIATSYSNVYYFSNENRLKFFRKTLGLLRKGGRFMLATMVKDSRPMSNYFDLLFTATEGLYPLISADEVASDMKKAGFRKTRIINILGSASFMGVVGEK
ncbi:MAG: methyltransferase domain-containing protein [Spirochaetes bacterium]|jgi:SAM-dependent methyltransferase|nr:methyltransferase domain-containing protein [Spirochaetota bacterium]